MMKFIFFFQIPVNIIKKHSLFSLWFSQLSRKREKKETLQYLYLGQQGLRISEPQDLKEAFAARNFTGK